jgi:hypothetical protein
MNVSAHSWRHPPSREVARARLAGRRRYHEWRQGLARARREVVGLLLVEYGRDTSGVVARVAAEVGCHKSTIWRDRQALREQWAIW